MGLFPASLVRVTSHSPQGRSIDVRRRLRSALGVLGVIFLIALVIPPFSSWAHRYEFMQAVQFSFFAIVIPALFVASAPWRLLGLASRDELEVDPDGKIVSPIDLQLMDRLALSRRRVTSHVGAISLLVVFLVVAIFWRVAPIVDYTNRHGFMVVPEALSLVIAGSLFWLDLIESPPMSPGITRPFRIAMSAIAMWSIWIVAYLNAMSHDSWYRSFHHVVGHGVSLSADQQLTAGFMWALSAFAFLPVVFWNLIHWLQTEEDPTDELVRMLRQERALGPTGGPTPL
ncbi:MAG: cytochrome c oxidase assembly protein [Acidimicrobiales bacterium]